MHIAGGAPFGASSLNSSTETATGDVRRSVETLYVFIALVLASQKWTPQTSGCPKNTRQLHSVLLFLR